MRKSIFCIVWIIWLLSGCLISQSGTPPASRSTTDEVLPTASANPLPIYATNTRLPTSTPDLPASPPIIFESSRDGNYELFVVNPDGSGLEQITEYAVAANVSNNSPSWSPDGTQVVFSSRQADDWDIHVIDADGSSETNLTATVGEDDKATWSPDGQWIAFSSRRTGARWPDIWIMQADGSSPTNLTTHPDDDREPSFSPNGSEILFRSFRDGNYDIYVMDVEGRAAHQLTKTDDPVWNLSPAWSPDGTQIAYETNVHGNWDIYLMDTNGLNQRNLTPGSADDKQPAWSPDGRFIAFSSDRDGNPEIYVIEVATGEITRLTYDCGGDFNPDWRRVGEPSSDGLPPQTIVAYVSRSAPINLRSGPGTEFDSVGGAALNECLTIIGRGESGTWLQVRTSSGEIAWVAQNLLSLQGDLANVPVANE